jgi:peptidoglycan hydrolase CwlO-like protein
MSRLVVLAGLLLLLVSFMVVGCSSTQLTELENDLDAALTELDDAEAEIASLQNQLNDAQSNLLQTQSVLALTESDLADAENQTLTLQNALNAADAEISRLMELNTELNASWESMMPYIEATNEVVGVFVLSEMVRFSELSADVTYFGDYVDNLENEEITDLWVEALGYQQSLDYILFDKMFVNIIERIITLLAEKIDAFDVEIASFSE